MRNSLCAIVVALISAQLGAIEYGVLETTAGQIKLPLYEPNPEQEKRFKTPDEVFEKSIPPGKRRISIKSQMSPVRLPGQGDRGTCISFAAIALLEFYHPVNDFSEQCLAKMVSDVDGGWIDDNVQYAVDHGVYSDSDCPYKTYPAGRDIVPSLRGKPIFWPSGGFTYFDSNMDDPVAKIKERLDAGHVVGVSFFLAGKGWKSGRNIVHAPSQKQIEEECKQNPTKSLSFKKKCKGHGVVITGYDDVLRCFEFKNSWGKRFGDNGYGRISYAYYLKMRKDEFVAK